jgi:uncharacterized membrane protein HdeD (DUF308 family)
MEKANSPVEPKTNRRPWWLLFIEGIIGIILGSVLLWAPAKTQQDTWIILVVFLGLYWLVSGILGLARLFQNQRQLGWKMFTGILSILAGVYILIYPAASAAALPFIIVLVLGIWGVIHGLTRLTLAFRGAGWGSGVLGVLMLMLGIILIVNWTNPSWGLALLYVAAAVILIGGIVLLVISMRRQPQESSYMYLY